MKHKPEEILQISAVEHCPGANKASLDLKKLLQNTRVTSSYPGLLKCFFHLFLRKVSADLAISSLAQCKALPSPERAVRSYFAELCIMTRYRGKSFEAGPYHRNIYQK